MGGHEGWVQPNGLLPNEPGSVIRVLDLERWSKAEERTAELIACIQANQPSEQRRNAVADYVQRLIMKCFPCQVFTFGSVPLKTYLPDGDIDLTAFSKNQNLKDTWASQVRDMLESEEKSENAEFRVKEVQYIQAEVKVIKCLVENIVVDISFNQLGGLCTLCFLEEVDHFINQNHLFKRSIILIKAWCYYESRILGAHHGLISTYALETLVLYIFHVFNNSFTGPLEVLYRFLEFFSNFDWDNFCVSLWGPVPISALPDVTAEPPRKDSGKLLLSKSFLDACNSVYAVFPGGQENQGLPFVSKHFNVIDPLRVNNNLGRSVSKGNFYRIRSAFAFGVKRLARVLDCPMENINFELNQFFMNTWERHGSGNRPDAPMSELHRLRPSNSDHIQKSDDRGNGSNNKNVNQNSSAHEIEVEGPQTSRINEPKLPNEAEKGNSNRGQRSRKPDHMVNEVKGRYFFNRTRSSPELTETFYDASSRARRNQPAESGKTQKKVASENFSSPHEARDIFIDSNRKKAVSENISSPREARDIVIDSNSVSNNFNDESAMDVSGEERGSVVGAHGMHQEEQDLVNMMASSSVNFSGPVQMPSMNSTQLPLQMGYVPGNFPFFGSHWGPNLQFNPGLISSPLAQYFPGMGLASNTNASVGHSDENEFWNERDEPSNEDDRQPSTSAGSKFIPSYRAGGSNFNKENRGSMREDHLETSLENRLNEYHPDDRISSSRFSSVSQADSARSKTSSESSGDGTSRISKVSREKPGRKVAASAGSSALYGKGKGIGGEDGNRDWIPESPTDTETGARSSSLIPMTPMILGPESGQTATDNSGVAPITFYPTGPPVPFVTMLPFYNFPNETGEVGPGDDGLGSGQNLNASENHEEPEASDILNSDFASHWQNLQYGRFCQTTRFTTPIIHPSQVMVPPMYLQGRVPWDGPGRPVTGNVNVLSRLMNYGSHLVPAAVQSASNNPVAVYQRYPDEPPRYRSGTGTYLPNPKASMRDRHTSGARRNNHNYDRIDHYGDREPSWSTNPKPRSSGRSHNRTHSEKLSSRSDRPWTHNGPTRANPAHSNSNHMAYGSHPTSPGGVSANGPTVPSVVMLYPYEHGSRYVSTGEQLEFGSLGPVSFVGMNDVLQPGEASRAKGTFEEHGFQR